MEIINYYSAFDNVCKNYNIPNDISRYIFNFEIENLKKKIIEKKKKSRFKIFIHQGSGNKYKD